MKKYLLMLVPVLLPVLVYANGVCNPWELCNPLGFDSVAGFLTAILNAVITIAFPIIILFIVFIGFRFIAAQGKPEEITKVKTYLFWAIVGALIVLGAQALSLAIQGTVQGLSSGVL